MFSVTIEGERELAQDWLRVRASVRHGMRVGVEKGVNEGAAEARTHHRFRNRTGRLEGSILGRLVGSSDNEQRGEMVATAKYASFVEEGTRPHKIPAKNGGMLVFEWQGRTMRVRSVNHPGQKTPLPFMSMAYLKCERVALREIEIGIKQAQDVLDR